MQSRAELFEPGEYLNQHGPGFFAIATVPQGERWRENRYELRLLPDVIENLDKDRDSYLSQATFDRPRRRNVFMASVGLLFADLDTYRREGLKGLGPEAITARLLDYCQDEGIPAPSIVMFSGRGLQAKWLLSEAVGKESLPVWEQAETALVDALEGFGSDHGAKDVSRVLRIDHTVNTKSGQRARVVHVTGGIEDCPARYDFKELHTVLTSRYLPVEAYQRREAAHRATRRSNVISGAFTWQNLNWLRLCDLQRLWEIRGGVPEGYRETTLFWELNFLLRAKPGRTQDIWKEAQALAADIDRAAGWYKDSDLTTLYGKAKANLDGVVIEYQGKKYPALYTPRNTTLLERFQVTPDEEQHLTTIISKAEKERRRIERRREAGMKPREEYAIAARTRPWESMGISRRTWYRQGWHKCGASLAPSPALPPGSRYSRGTA